MLPVFFFFLDQVCKFLIRSRLAVGETVFRFGPFGITHFENTAGPFSLHIPFSALIIAHALVLSVVLVAYLRDRKERAGLLWILAGGTSNLMDRLFIGSTTDYLALPFHGYWNLADVAVLVGILLIVGRKPTSPHVGA